MLVIRLARMGAKKKPDYRVVVLEKERARNGTFVEVVGHYNPRSNPPKIELNVDRIDYWVGKGAHPSNTVARLLKVKGSQPPEKVEVAS